MAQFSGLPTEIRLNIWGLLLPSGTSSPRVIPVKDNDATNKLTHVGRTTPPLLLHINQESRSEALKIYHELRLGSRPIHNFFVEFPRDYITLSTDSDLPNANFVKLDDSSFSVNDLLPFDDIIVILESAWEWMFRRMSCIR